MADREATGVRHSRSALDPAASVDVAVGGIRASAGILDVSVSGLRVVRPPQLAATIGQFAELSFPLDSERPLVLRAVVVRSGDAEVAFRFEPMGPLQEDALRALIERRGQLRDNYGGE